jgi:hypothetical protein
MQNRKTRLLSEVHEKVQKSATVENDEPTTRSELLDKATALTAPFSGYYMYHHVQLQQLLRSAHTMYLGVLCGSENKQRLFPHTQKT